MAFRRSVPALLSVLTLAVGSGSTALERSSSARIVPNHSATGSQPAANPYLEIQALLSARRFPEAAQLIEHERRRSPADPRAVRALALMHLLEDDVDAADGALQELDRMPGGAAFAAALRPVAHTMRRQRGLRADLAAALAALDSARARQVLGSMELPSEQGAAAEALLDLYEARFSSALMRSARVPSLATELRTNIRQASERYSHLMEQVDWYRNSPLASQPCTPDSARAWAVQHQFSLVEYVRLVDLAYQQFPLNPRVLDAAFHAALLAAPEPALLALGDRILATVGQLRMPFFSRDARLVLTVDARNRRLQLGADRSKDGPAFGVFEELTPHVPFDLPFAEIKELSQRAGQDVVTGALSRDSYAVKVQPNGVAPHYLFMPGLQCLYGEAAQKEATRKLGRFLQHAIGPGVNARLENPGVKSRDWLSGFTGAVAFGSLAVSSSSSIWMQRESGVRMAPIAIDSSQLTGQLLEERKKAAGAVDGVRKVQAESRAVWTDALAERALSFVERVDVAVRFRELDAALQGLTSER